MILDVALAAESAADLDVPQSRRRADARAAAIAKRLMGTSTIVIDSAASRRRLLDAAESLPGYAREIWVELLQPNSPYVRVDSALPLNEDFDAEALRAWHGHVDLVVLPKYHVELLDEEVDLPESPEISDLADLANSNAIRDLEALRTSAVPEKSSREQLWRERLKPACNRAIRLYIIDNFAAEQVVKQVLAGKEGAAAGVEWFLRKVAMTNIRSVRLVTRFPDKYLSEESRLFDQRPGSEDVIQTFSQLANKVGLGNRLKTYVVEVSKRDFAHERHLVFDGRLHIAPHNGLASFSEGRFSRAISFTASAESAPDMLALFRELAAHAR